VADVFALAEELQTEAAEALVKSWKDLMDCLEAKSGLLASRGPGRLPSSSA